MTEFFLSLHVLAAIVAVGPVTVAAGMFPGVLALARAEPGDPGRLATLRTLHRICRVYAAVGIAVPVFGFATASSLGVLGSAWLIISIVLTACAAAILATFLLPGQEEALAAVERAAEGPPAPGAPPPTAPAATAPATPAVPTPISTARLHALTGVFNLLWATVTVLMIVRPGSTTGG